MYIIKKCINHQIKAIILLSAFLGLSSSWAAQCPVSPTEYADVTIPDVDPPPAAGEFPADMDLIFDYITSNNINSVKELIDHMPLHMRKHYSFIKDTGALNETDLNNPGLLPWGSDSRFMMNIGTKPSAALYEVVDMAYLQDDGDWEFRSIDFRGSTPFLSPDGGVDGECRQCHAKDGTNAPNEMRPILGNYLFWTGFFSDSNGASGEDVTAEEKPVLDAIKAGTQNNDRFHKIIISDSYYAEVGVSNMLPDHAYGPGLTIFNTEIASAVADSVHLRASRNSNYRGLREELLALSYCKGEGSVSSAQENQILDIVEGLGGSRSDFAQYNSWGAVYQALGIEPKHEFPLHFKTEDSANVTDSDINWNTGVSDIREVVDLKILMELAAENNTLNNLLANATSSYEMTGGCSFNSLKDHLDHKMFAMFTLRGNARQLARESYYDIDYARIHASLSNVRAQMCQMLTADIGLGTIGDPGNNTNQSPIANANGPYNGTVNSPISFSSAGSSDPDGSISAYLWSFGDGSTSTLANPSHTYTSEGTFNVTLRVTDNLNAQKSASTTAAVSGGGSTNNELQNGVSKTGLSAATSAEIRYFIDVPANASNLVIAINGGSGDADLYTRFNAEPTTASGNYDCRPYQSGNAETCTHANATQGRWHVMVRAYSAFSGLTLTASYDGGGTSNEAPIANANGPYAALIGAAVNFSSNGSSDPDGTISSYAWDFGDGTSGNGANPSHSYSSAGSYTATLTVTDNDNSSTSSTAAVTISENTSGNNVLVNGVPKTGLTANTGQELRYYIDVPSGATNLQIAITGGTGDADLYTRFNAEPATGTGNFDCRPYKTGNEETCTQATPSTGRWHVMVRAYSTFSGITLTASYDSGGTQNQAPVAQANGPYSGEPNTAISMSSNGSSDPDGTIASYAWDFGDGNTSTQANPSHSYSADGSYTVTLTVTDNLGLQSSDTATATVSSSNNGATVLGNGASITGLSGAAQEELAFYIHVHGANSKNLSINISGGTGDVDMYVKHDAMPTTSVYDCRPYLSGNNETCSFPTPSTGPYFIVLRGYEAFTNVTLTGSFEEDTGGTQHLIMIHNSSQYGNYLAGGANSSRSGMSLYVWDTDNGTNGSQCNGSCATTWPPLTVANASDISAPAGAGNLGTITRNDGTLQVTLEGRPLYFFANDSAMGDTNGEGSGGTWWLAKVGSSSTNNEYGLVDACGAGRTAMSNMTINLGEAYCTQNASSNAQEVHFKYVPTASDVGKDILFTIGHGSGIAGITANQDFGNYASESDFNSNPSQIMGSFGLDPLNNNRTYNRVIVKNVQANKDIWLSVIAGQSGFSNVAIKGEQVVAVDASLPDACAAGKPEITDEYVNLGEEVCGKASQGPGYYTHFTYRPTAAEAGKTFILEMDHGTGHGGMTVNQHYSSAPTSGGTAFAHEEHLADRPDLVFSSFNDGITQRVVYPNAEAGKDILVVVPPGPNGFSKFTFRIRME